LRRYPTRTVISASQTLSLSGVSTAVINTWIRGCYTSSAWPTRFWWSSIKRGAATMWRRTRRRHALEEEWQHERRRWFSCTASWHIRTRLFRN